MITIKDIAKSAGVSVATVSYVLNNTGSVSAVTRKRVIEIARELGYVASDQPFATRVKHYKNIGVVFRIFKGAYYHRMLEAIYQTAANRYKYGIQLILTQNEKNDISLIKNITSMNVDSLIILSDSIQDSTIDKLVNRGIPLVFLDREINDNMISSVLTDNYKGIMEVMEYLVKNGHHRIAYMRGDKLYNDCKRFDAYVDVMKRHNLPIDPSMILRADYDALYAEAHLLMHYDKMKFFPDAICCANDEMARGCIKALESKGFSIPKDISVTGFDDSLHQGDCSVPLTTVRNPIEKVAKEAVEEAIRLIENGGAGKTLFVEPEFIERNSCTILKGD